MGKSRTPSARFHRLRPQRSAVRFAATAAETPRVLTPTAALALKMLSAAEEAGAEPEAVFATPAFEELCADEELELVTPVERASEEAASPESSSAEPAELEEPPFDAPDANDEIFRVQSLEKIEADAPDELLLVNADHRARAGLRPFAEPEASAPPAPAITIQARWHRPEMAGMFAAFAADARMARADIEVERGGFDSAARALKDQDTLPEVLLFDTTLGAEELLAGLRKIAPAIENGTRVVIIGAVNDIALLRELSAMGVSYLLPPVRAEDIVNLVCNVFAEADNARVIAVVGARGGVGASTLAHNIAWSIAERQRASTALVELDLAFGAAAFNVHKTPTRSVAEALLAPTGADDGFIDTLVTSQSERLKLLAAPATLDYEHDLDAAAFENVIRRARRTSAFVVIDLPHRWTSWVRQILLTADDVLVVATPDLASLRNTKNIIDAVGAERPYGSTLAVALSMAGVPQRPDIALKDFADAVGTTPVETFAFDPALFGLAATNGQMIGEAAPHSKAAIAIDALACSLTGRRIAKAKPAKKQQVKPDSAPAPKQVVAEPAATTETPAAAKEYPFSFAPPSVEIEKPVLELVHVAPSNDEYLLKWRERARADKRRGRPGAIRWAAAFMVTMYCGGFWYGELRSAAAAPAPQVVAPVVVEAPAAQYARALELMSANPAQGAALMRRAAEGGIVLAQYRLAKAYESGEGVAIDLGLARQWTARAPAAGNARAMHDLGVFFARGDGGAMNDVAAFRWFRQAAEFGVADSQFNLGVLYQQGRGVAANKAEALFWFTLAARQGDTASAEHIAQIEALLPAQQVAQARARAAAFRPRTPDPATNAPAETPAAPAAPAPLETNRPTPANT